MKNEAGLMSREKCNLNSKKYKHTSLHTRLRVLHGGVVAASCCETTLREPSSMLFAKTSINTVKEKSQ